MAQFDTIPEIGKMLIASYNNKCKEDICNLAAIYEQSGYKLKSLFKDITKFKKTNTEKEYKQIVKKYEKVVNNFTDSMGDGVSIINLYNEYSSYKYDKIDKKTGEILIEKKGDIKEWCDNNFVNNNFFDKIKYVSGMYHRQFSKIIDRQKKKYPNKKYNRLFLKENEKIILSEDKNENILNAILTGFCTNIIEKIGNEYKTCQPKIQEIGSLPDNRRNFNSFFINRKQNTKYAVYTELKSIFGRKSFGIISRMPSEFVNILNNNENTKILLTKCKNKKDEKKHNNNYKKNNTVNEYSIKKF